MRKTIAPLALACLVLAAPPAAALVLPIPVGLPVPGLWTGWNHEWDAAPAGGDAFALRLVSASAGPAYSYISVAMPSGVQVEDLTTLRLATYYESGSCGGGAPRVGLAIDEDGDGDRDGMVSVYIGPGPSFQGCAGGVWAGNDLLDGTLRFDSTQVGGPFYGSQAQAQAAAGPAHRILSVSVFVDSYWMAGNDPQVVWVDDVTINCFELSEPRDSVITIVEGVTGLCM